MNLTMPQGVKDQLEILRDETDAESLSEVIRKALALYDLVWDEKSKGSKMIFRSEDGKNERELHLL